MGLQMGKFWQISTELRPLIDVRNWFSLSIFGIPLPIFFKLGMRFFADMEIFKKNKNLQNYPAFKELFIILP